MHPSKNIIDIEEQLAIEKRRVNYYKTQLKYLKEHIDITQLKPASGELKEFQLDLVEFATQFFKEIGHLKIKPFLMAGSLIGALRHRGFIPWDDDLDFGLIREDYYKLVEFCRSKYKTILYDTSITDYLNNPYAAGLKWDTTMEKFPNEYVFFIWSDHIQIGKGNSVSNYKAIDFFSFDSFGNDYDFKAHKQYLSGLKNKIDEIDYLPEIVNFLEKEQKIIPKFKNNGENIYFGIDNMCAYRQHYNKWMPRDWFFPLKKIKFENTKFWVPNQAEKYLEYEKGDYMKFPNDLGCSSHLYHINKYVSEFKESDVEFYLIDSFEIYHYLPIYKYLVKNGVNAIIIAEPPEMNTAKKWFDYDAAIKILNELNLPYKTECNPNCKVAITTQDAFLLEKYKNIKINMSYGVGLSKNNFSFSKRTCDGFNYRWVNGEFQKKHLSKYMPEENIKIIGYTKHNSFLKKIPKKKDIIEQLNIQTKKQILVYLPTWDEDTSINLFGDEINKLRSKYFVVTKAHHCTFRLPEKKKDLEKIYEVSDLVLEGNSSFAELSILGDIIICDAKSGAGVEIKFLNPQTPMLLLSVHEDVENYFMPELFSFANVISDPLALKGSISKIKRTKLKIKVDYFLEKNFNNFDIIKENIFSLINPS